MNCYRFFGLLVVQDATGAPAYFLLSDEGCIQGDPLAMNCYAIGMLPLIEHMRTRFETLQAWFADDFAVGATPEVGAVMMQELERKGLSMGYYIEPDKSYFVCKEGGEAHVGVVFAEAGMVIQFSRGGDTSADLWEWWRREWHG